MIISDNIDNYFAGEFAYDKDKLMNFLPYIDKIEKQIIVDVIGNDLAQQFFENLQNGLPVSEKWNEFVAGITYQEDDYFATYKGILEMLQYFILYNLIMFQEPVNSEIGRLDLQSLYAQNQSNIKKEIDANGYYNNAISLFNDVYVFFEDRNIDFNKTADSIIDNLDGTFTINISDTEFLNAKQPVYISGKKYFIFNVIENTSFDISEVAGTIFTSYDFQFKKYGDFTQIKKMPKPLINY